MTYAKKSKGRAYFQIPSNKEIGFVKYHLTSKLSSTYVFEPILSKILHKKKHI